MLEISKLPWLPWFQPTRTGEVPLRLWESDGAMDHPRNYAFGPWHWREKVKKSGVSECM